MGMGMGVEIAPFFLWVNVGRMLWAFNWQASVGGERKESKQPSERYWLREGPRQEETRKEPRLVGDYVMEVRGESFGNGLSHQECRSSRHITWRSSRMRSTKKVLRIRKPYRKGNEVSLQGWRLWESGNRKVCRFQFRGLQTQIRLEN